MWKLWLTILLVVGGWTVAYADGYVETTGSYPEGTTIRGDRYDLSGNKKMTLGTLLSCEDQTNQVCRVEFNGEYEDVAASQTNQVIGGAGAVGDLVVQIFCTTSAASVGVVSLKDGANAAFTIFQAQAAASALQSGILNWISTSGAWQLTTGTNTTCRVSGRFS